MRAVLFAAGAILALTGAAEATDLQATMHKVTEQGTGEEIGTIRISQGENGARFVVDLKGLPPGEHGFHVHGKGDCGPGPNDQGQVVAAGAAGGHWAPDGAKAHAGPAGEGHLGDLPLITANADGTASTTVTAPRIKDTSRLQGLALMVHAGGDNYADQPRPLGGGGGRIACGVIK